MIRVMIKKKGFYLVKFGTGLATELTQKCQDQSTKWHAYVQTNIFPIYNCVTTDSIMLTSLARQQYCYNITFLLFI